MAAEVSTTSQLRGFLELGDVEADRTPRQRLQVYRLVEAGLSHVIDHASLVMIEIKTEPGHVRIQLEADHPGQDPAATESGLIHCAGLGRRHQRAKLVGGAFRVSIAHSGGGRVRITVPLGRPEAR